LAAPRNVVEFRPGPRRKKGEGGDSKGEGKPRQRSEIAALLGDAEFWHDDLGGAYVTLHTDGHAENWSIRAKGGSPFKNWLQLRFFDRAKHPPGAQAVEDALRHCEALAQRGPHYETFIRVAVCGGLRYLDLGDEARRAVEIAPHAWRVVENPPVKFLRPRTTRPLPDPERGGSVSLLRPFIRTKSEADFQLAVAWLVYTLLGVPPYPVLVFGGESGSAKTSAARAARNCTDPRHAGTRSPPADERSLAIASRNAHILSFDNLSSIDGEMSDALCRLAYGEGFGTRELHTDGEEFIVAGARPIMLNGIAAALGRADLADRSITINMAPIARAERQRDSIVAARFLAAWPEILGALLDGAAGALADEPKTTVPGGYERMAEFCHWGTAAERGLGFERGAVIDAYRANRRVVVDVGIENDPVASAIRSYVLDHRRPVKGLSASQLLPELDAIVSDRVRHSRQWPSSAQKLGMALMRVAGLLRAHGFTVEHFQSNGNRWDILPPAAGEGSGDA